MPGADTSEDLSLRELRSSRALSSGSSGVGVPAIDQYAVFVHPRPAAF